jgi:hypothetical protein
MPGGRSIGVGGDLNGRRDGYGGRRRDGLFCVYIFPVQLSEPRRPIRSIDPVLVGKFDVGPYEAAVGVQDRFQGWREPPPLLTALSLSKRSTD